jgi:hypothetical protein
MGQVTDDAVVDEEKIMNKALAYYGTVNQEIIVVEELSELQKEVTKDLRGKLDIDHMTEEIADAEIAIKYLKLINHIPQENVDLIKKAKLQRLRNNLICEGADL